MTMIKDMRVQQDTNKMDTRVINYYPFFTHTQVDKMHNCVILI